MPDASVIPLREFLRPTSSVPAAPIYDEMPGEVLDEPALDDLASASDELLSQARRFHAYLHDVYLQLRERLLTDLAAGVLARELAVEPVAINALAAQLIAEYAREEPVRLRLHRSDVPLVEPRCALPIVADAALHPGDAVLEVRDGEIDARFGLRLEAVLANLLET